MIDPWTLTDGAATARAEFTETFGGEPDGVWSAPGRVNLIGEHTDYNGGLCLPIALPHRTFVALRARGDGGLGLVSGRESGVWSGELAAVGPGAVEGWPAYPAGVAWALAQEGVPVPGFDAAVASCVPYGAGLSSSAALESAFAVAIADGVGAAWPGPDPSGPDQDAGRAMLARACVRAENEVAGAPTGGMDQAASLRCADGHALLLDCRDGSTRQVPFDLAAADLELLVIDTRAEHALVDGQYAQRRATCEAAAEALEVPTLREIDPAGLVAALAALTDDVSRRRVRHVVSEIARVTDFVALLDAGRIRDVGPLMDASHESLRVDYEVSCAELDVAVEAARAAGALGARMTGGGFGGSAIALIEAGSAQSVADAVTAAFASAGFTAPEFLIATPSGPADRVA
ncbi:galactokinase [Occultella glacieicola]|uniref:Galactokinase n=1 Tax=Occultella glacieicola TaxID=2518684 RepID=A0ABY2E8V7_9MICO|nr:galactokinase [Occultella glacieicola]TDE97556.1 galactokinase [Occultella glacieicola]